MSNPPKKTRRARAGALAVGAYVPGIARAAFEAHGFPSASILSDWPEIIGSEYSDFTVPERLVWPHGTQRDERQDSDRKGQWHHRRSGATLVLRVDGPRALEVQHMGPQLLERINTYFGYRAVSELRLVQGPVRRKTHPPAPPSEQPAIEPALDDAIEDEGLRAALSRLGARLSD